VTNKEKDLRRRERLLKQALKQMAAKICLRDGLNPTDEELLAIIKRAFEEIKPELRTPR